VTRGLQLAGPERDSACCLSCKKHFDDCGLLAIRLCFAREPGTPPLLQFPRRCGLRDGFGCPVDARRVFREHSLECRAAARAIHAPKTAPETPPGRPRRARRPTARAQVPGPPSRGRPRILAERDRPRRGVAVSPRHTRRRPRPPQGPPRAPNAVRMPVLRRRGGSAKTCHGRRAPGSGAPRPSKRSPRRRSVPRGAAAGTAAIG